MVVVVVSEVVVVGRVAPRTETVGISFATAAIRAFKKETGSGADEENPEMMAAS